MRTTGCCWFYDGVVCRTVQFFVLISCACFSSPPPSHAHSFVFLVARLLMLIFGPKIYLVATKKASTVATMQVVAARQMVQILAADTSSSQASKEHASRSQVNTAKISE